MQSECKINEDTPFLKKVSEWCLEIEEMMPSVPRLFSICVEIGLIEAVIVHGGFPPIVICFADFQARLWLTFLRR